MSLVFLVVSVNSDTVGQDAHSESLLEMTNHIRGPRGRTLLLIRDWRASTIFESFEKVDKSRGGRFRGDWDVIMDMNLTILEFGRLLPQA